MSEKKKATPLSVMVGVSEEFIVLDKKYKVNPMPAAHVDEFGKSMILVDGNYVFALLEKKIRDSLDKWLGEFSVELSGGTTITNKYCRNEKDELMTLDKAYADGWLPKDFKRYAKFLVEISG